MAQPKIDRKKIIEKFKAEYGCDDKRAKLNADRLEAVHPDLIPMVDAWCKDEFLDYTFRTMSISHFMELHKKNYITAITWMDSILKDPESLELFHNPFFFRR